MDPQIFSAVDWSAREDVSATGTSVDKIVCARGDDHSMLEAVVCRYAVVQDTAAATGNERMRVDAALRPLPWQRHVLAMIADCIICDAFKL